MTNDSSPLYKKLMMNSSNPCFKREKIQSSKKLYTKPTPFQDSKKLAKN
jgi:hypothetical protein